MKVFIKNLSHRHLDDVMEVEELSYGEHHWSRDSFAAEIKGSVSQYLCAENEDGKCIGYMGMWKIIDEAHVTTLAVHPDYRKQGIAHALLIASVEKCMRDKIKYITLEVRESNEGAIKLYEKFGFRSLGLRKKYYQNNNEDALIMWSENIFFENFRSLYNKNKEALLKKGTEVIDSE